MNTKWFKLGSMAALIAVVAVMAFGSAAFAQGPIVNVADTTVRVVPLTEAEKAALIFMREEEKMARDVYLTLYAKYQLPVFNNIAKSEAQHMAAIKTLLDRYGVADPSAGKAIGEFTNPDLQALYNQLVAQGSQSLTEAYKVGVTIENVDIADLKTHLAETSKADIKFVYNNLLRGSQNHLRSFQKFLGQ